MHLPTNVNFIISALESAGYEAFIVGGCVRDAIRGVTPKDWDIATSATPVQAKALFRRTIDTGIKHGTITVLLDRQHYEVTTYRIDGEYLDNRRPETVEFTSSIEDDLSRRDFTMNAIAYNPRRGFVDPFGGQDDIRMRIIRCVGSPIHRFGEDALRMLRAIRFSGTTGFAVCENLLEAISTLKQNLTNVSPERIRDEMGKLITSPHPEVVELMYKTGLLPFVLQVENIDPPAEACLASFSHPLKKEDCDTILAERINWCRNISLDIPTIVSWLKNCPPYEPMRMALFLHSTGGACESILRNMRFDNKAIKEISLYVRILYTAIPQNRYKIKKILRHMPQDLFENLLKLKSIIDPSQAQMFETIRQEAEDICKNGECFTLQNLAINGSDLAELGILPGKQMGDILESLLDNVMQEPSLNTKEKLLEFIPPTA